jgi:hypothetical protein
MKALPPKVPILVQAADVLQRARKLPPGPARNDLQQLAQGLLKLHRAGMRANAEFIERSPSPRTNAGPAYLSALNEDRPLPAPQHRTVASLTQAVRWG